MNKEALFYDAYNAYLNSMIKQAWGGQFAARRAQNAYARGNQAMGDRLMNRAYRRGYQQPMQQQPMQQPQQPPMQQPQQPMQPPQQPPMQQQQQPQQKPFTPAPYAPDSSLMMSTGERDMYGRPLQIADLRG